MSDCLFCKIINNDIPSVKIYEDDKVLAFLDISQTTKGHTLVIPKKHVDNVFQIDDDTMANIYRIVPKLSRAITSAFNAKGLNIVNNNGKAAGQTVFHYHVHLVPRFNDNDGLKVIYTNNMDKYSKEDLEETANLIREQIK